MRNLRNFGITFAVSLVLLGIVAIIASGYVAGAVTDIFNTHNKDLENIISQPAEENNKVEEKEDRFKRDLKGESFTWLMVVSDKRDDVYDYYPSKSQIEKADKDDVGILGGEYKLAEAAAIAVVHADVEAREYVVLTIPTITKLETGSGTMTLGEIYAVYGIEYLQTKVASIIGLDIDYYSVVNSTNLTAMSTTIGAVPVDLPVSIGFDGKEYVTFIEEEEETSEETKKEEKKDKEEEEDEEEEIEIKLELDAGEGVKLSKKLAAAVLYKDYSDGIEHEMIIVRSFVNGILQNLSKMSDSSLNSALTGLSSVIKSTNINSEAVKKCGETIRAYSWLPTENVVYTGRFVEGAVNKAPTYIPDVSEMVNYFYKYR